jgi:ubiquitin C-terminal hydrolase
MNIMENNKSSDPDQPVPKIIYGNTGIINTGATCYMNSSIQAFSHLNPLTRYFFNNTDAIIETLKSNANKIFKDDPAFSLETTSIIVPDELKKKIHNPNYNKSMLTESEADLVLNHTMTFHLIKLLRAMWTRNCIVSPTSFRNIFTKARNKFFHDRFEQHDAEEAYSCILQKVQEELAETKNVNFKTTNPSINEFHQIQNKYVDLMKNESDPLKKKQFYDEFLEIKKKMPNESVILESFREMKKYYGSAFCKITDLFSGFFHSNITCPDCGNTSNKFDPFLHIPLEIQVKKGVTIGPQTGTTSFVIPNLPYQSTAITVYDCLTECCKEETLDQNNLWHCESCNKKVKGVKKLSLWTNPQILVIQLKRFNHFRGAKDSRLITYPMNDLDISPYISPANRDPSRCYKYTLQCVVNHYGGLHGGHYYTYSKDEESGKWFNYNDQLVNEIRPTAVVNQCAYLLYYVRNDMFAQQPTQPTPQTQSQIPPKA